MPLAQGAVCERGRERIRQLLHVAGWKRQARIPERLDVLRKRAGNDAPSRGHRFE